LIRHTLNENLARISAAARRAARARNWTVVNNCTREIFKHDKRNPEGWFLTGLLEKDAGRNQAAVAAFSKSLQFDAKRYDAAVELASLCLVFLHYREAVALLQRYESSLDNSPFYLDMAANTYTRLGLHARAWPLYRKANELQVDSDKLQESLAACAVLLGKTKSARAIYHTLLTRHPYNQKNHYELSLLECAQDSVHVEQMEEILEATKLAPEKNIFLYYALGKELEDLERWPEAFHYYRLGGDAAAGQAEAAGHDAGAGEALIDRIIEVCTGKWLGAGAEWIEPGKSENTPIFIVGLPRSGTRLCTQILSGHPKVESAGETPFMQTVIQRLAGAGSKEGATPAVIEAAAKNDIELLAKGYLGAVGYKLRGRPLFVDALPGNYLYLGFIARAFPGAHIIHLKRNPMDACFAMYRQFSLKYTHTLDDLGRYYAAYNQLTRHWRDVLKDRVIEVEYEKLVSERESQTGILLDRLGLPFEQDCLNIDRSERPGAPGGALQRSENEYIASVNKWKNWEAQLQPLRERLEKAGVRLD
jgi:hypothetical protein